jgi:metal-dependent HD superfamily phosphatase/phosphodiesterase
MSDREESAPQYADWLGVSPKQDRLDGVLMERTTGATRELLARLSRDQEVHQMLSYANVVSVRRLGYNDHGPVHARLATYHAVKMLRLLSEQGVQPSIVDEEVGTYEDAEFAVALGTFLHDAGMGVTRQDHEWHSINLIDPIIRREIAHRYAEGDPMRHVVRALVHECIVGHMAHVRVYSVEAGVTLVADGTDMARGRARVSSSLSSGPVVGDIHRHSASSITRVDVKAGTTKPVHIAVQMRDATGLFQIEEVLMTKVKASPIYSMLEISAQIDDGEPRFYLR